MEFSWKRCLKQSLGLALTLSLFSSSRTSHFGSDILFGYEQNLIFSIVTMFAASASFLLFAFIGACVKNTYSILTKTTTLGVPIGFVFLLAILYELIPDGFVLIAVVAAALSLGVGISAGVLCWITVISLESNQSLKYYALLQQVLWGVLVLTMHLLSLKARMWISLVLFGLCAILLYSDYGGTMQELNPVVGKNKHPRESVTTRHILSIMWRPIVLVSVLCFASGAIRVVGASSYPGFGLTLMHFLSAMASAVAFFAIYSRIINGFSFNSLFMVALLISATACILFPFVLPDYRIVLLGIVDAVYMFSTIVWWVYSILVAKSNTAAPATTMGLFSGAGHFFVAAGVVTGSSIGSSTDALSVLAPSMAAVYLIVAAAVIVNIQRKGEKDPSENKKAQSIIIGLSEDDVRKNQAFVNKYHLTDRELDVILLTLSGRNARGIAELLFVSENTVRTHLKKIYKKLNVHSKEELAEVVRASVLFVR